MSGAFSVQYNFYTVLNWIFCVYLVTYLNLNPVFQNVTCATTSFTDLAEIVSRIEPVKAPVADGELRDPASAAMQQEGRCNGVGSFTASLLSFNSPCCEL